MPDEPLATLADCTEFRQTLLARPPRVLHGTVALVVMLLGSAVVWSAKTDADLVVRLTGRVRPVTSPQQVTVAIGGEVRTSTEGRVVAVHVHAGDEVRTGQLLVQLDTQGLDIEISKRRRTIQTDEDELAELDRLLKLADVQHVASHARANAELVQARTDVQQARDRQASDIRLARIDRSVAEDEVRRFRKLSAQSAVPEQELFRAELRLQEAGEKLARTELPVADGRIDVLVKTLEQLDADNAIKRKELVLKRWTRQSEVEAARSDLTNLDLQRQQTSLRSPCDGVVTAGEVKVGDMLDRGKPVFEIAAQGNFRFEGTVPSEEVGHLRVGQSARIRLDAFDYQRYGSLTGTVTFIAPDSHAGDGPKSVQHLVRIDVVGTEIGRDEWRGKVKLGMAGQADIVTGQECLLALLAKRVRQTISLN